MSRSSGDAFANGPSQPSLGAHPPNPVFMPLPQPGYANSIPNKGPIPPGPASFNTHRLSSAGSMPAASADLMPPSTSFMSPTGSFMPASSPALMPGLTPATSHGLMPPPSGLMPASSPGLLPPASSGSVPAFDVAASSGLLLGSMPASPGHRTVQGIQGPSPALGYAHNASGWSGATLPPPAQSTSTASGYNTHGISGTHALNAPALHQAFGAPAVLRGPPPPPPAGAVHHAGGQSIGTSLQTNHSSMNTALPPPAYSNYNQQNHCQQNQYQQQNHQYQNQHLQPSSLSGSLAGLSLGSGAPEALKPINLLQERNVLPPGAVKPPTPCLPQDQQRLNCCPEVFRCTLTSIPQTQSLLNKAKLPLGLLLHPFKDLSQLPVVTSSNIVRCRSCRTYINPFVSFINPTRWKCNLCHRVNEVPEEFMYNPVSKSYGSPHKRPEVQNATIEFIAPSEYMLRPPQPAVYLFVLDVSHNAVETGYLEAFSRCLLDNLDSLPGDARTKIGFITFDSTIHFYNLQEGLSRPQMLMVSEIDDVFLPSQEGLLVNLNESKELVRDLLVGLPELFNKTMQTHSALGPALQAAFKLLAPTGGRVSVCVTQLPNLGTGALRPREESGQKTKETVQNLSPSTDFYKKLALDCSGHQVAVDLFLLSSQYCDLASIGCVSRYSAGSVYYYPSYHKQHNPCQTERFQKDLKRYLTRKIGFEGVMRIRCTKGLSIHTFHGNFFVRSTDLLSLANVNPDAGFAVQMSIDENLVDLQSVSFQAALLYTSSRGERRIRVHTLCLPVVNSLSDIFAGADVQAITALLANMAVDRCVSSSLSDARDALMNAVLDLLSSYKSSELHVNQQHTGVMVPGCLRVSPLHTLALLKHKAFRAGSGQRIDDRVFSLIQLKQQPLAALMINIHPNLYRVDQLDDEGALNVNDCTIPQPPVLQLSAEKLSRDGAFLMDCGSVMYLWVGRNCSSVFLSQVLGVENYTQIPLDLMELPELDSPESSRLRSFINWLRERRPLHTLLHIVREESALKAEFLLNLIEDSSESGLSYYDFLLHLQKQSSK